MFPVRVNHRSVSFKRFYKFRGYQNTGYGNMDWSFKKKKKILVFHWDLADTPLVRFTQSLCSQCYRWLIDWILGNYFSLVTGHKKGWDSGSTLGMLFGSHVSERPSFEFWTHTQRQCYLKPDTDFIISWLSTTNPPVEMAQRFETKNLLSAGLHPRSK